MPSPSFLRAEYQQRLNRVLDHIQAHLDEPLDLQALARVACFSPFHFHRLFRSWTGETLQAYLQRLRLERAAGRLRRDPGLSVTEAALDAGFSGPDTFARAFRERFGLTATDWRRQERNPGKADRKGRQAEGMAGAADFPGSGPMAEPQETTMFPLDVHLQDLPPLSVAYLRHLGPYKGDAELFGQLFGRLCAWAGPRGLLGPGATFLSLYHDDPDLTPEASLRLEVAVTVPPATVPEGPVGRMEVPGGRFAVARVRIPPSQYEAVWASLMGGWLPGSGYQPDDRPCMEIYRNDPARDPEGLHEVDLCLPVRPL